MHLRVRRDIRSPTNGCCSGVVRRPLLGDRAVGHEASFARGLATTAPAVPGTVTVPGAHGRRRPRTDRCRSPAPPGGSAAARPVPIRGVRSGGECAGSAGPARPGPRRSARATGDERRLVNIGDHRNHGPRRTSAVVAGLERRAASPDRRTDLRFAKASTSCSTPGWNPDVTGRRARRHGLL